MMTKTQYEKFCKEAENMNIYDGRNTFDLYECKKCTHKLVTTYAVKGVTPFIIRCSECGMTMTHTRTFGSVPDYVPVVKWVRPTYEQYKKLSAGRLMSRKKAKEAIPMAEFEKSMSDVYSTSVCESTLDEAPQAYKPMRSIIDAIHDTVDIVKIIKPIYNFKAKD